MDTIAWYEYVSLHVLVILYTHALLSTYTYISTKKEMSA